MFILASGRIQPAFRSLQYSCGLPAVHSGPSYRAGYPQLTCGSYHKRAHGIYVFHGPLHLSILRNEYKDNMMEITSFLSGTIETCVIERHPLYASRFRQRPRVIDDNRVSYTNMSVFVLATCAPVKGTMLAWYHAPTRGRDYGFTKRKVCSPPRGRDMYKKQESHAHHIKVEFRVQPSLPILPCIVSTKLEVVYSLCIFVLEFAHYRTYGGRLCHISLDAVSSRK